MAEDDSADAAASWRSSRGVWTADWEIRKRRRQYPPPRLGGHMRASRAGPAWLGCRVCGGSCALYRTHRHTFNSGRALGERRRFDDHSYGTSIQDRATLIFDHEHLRQGRNCFSREPVTVREVDAGALAVRHRPCEERSGVGPRVRNGSRRLRILRVCQRR